MTDHSHPALLKRCGIAIAASADGLMRIKGTPEVPEFASERALFAIETIRGLREASDLIVGLVDTLADEFVPEEWRWMLDAPWEPSTHCRGCGEEFGPNHTRDPYECGREWHRRQRDDDR